MSITQEELKKIITYDPATGVMTKFKKRAGTSSLGRVVNINGKRYIACAIAWLYVYGKLPEFSIKHINGDVLDNSIDNLEPQPSKLRGVSWSKSHKKWQAQLVANKQRTFIGRFENEHDAHRAYVKAVSLLNADYL